MSYHHIILYSFSHRPSPAQPRPRSRPAKPRAKPSGRTKSLYAEGKKSAEESAQHTGYTLPARMPQQCLIYIQNTSGAANGAKDNVHNIVINCCFSVFFLFSKDIQFVFIIIILSGLKTILYGFGYITQHDDGGCFDFILSKEVADGLEEVQTGNLLQVIKRAFLHIFFYHGIYVIVFINTFLIG